MFGQGKRKLIAHRDEARTQKATGIPLPNAVLFAEETAENKSGRNAAKDHECTE